MHMTVICGNLNKRKDCVLQKGPRHKSGETLVAGDKPTKATQPSNRPFNNISAFVTSQFAPVLAFRSPKKVRQALLQFDGNTFRIQGILLSGLNLAMISAPV